MSRLQICSERSEIAEARKSRQDYRRPRRRPFRCSRLQSHCSHLQGLHHWSHLPAHCLPRPRHHCLRPTACAWQLETHRHQLQRWLPRPRLLEFLKAPPPEKIFQVKLWHSRAKGRSQARWQTQPQPTCSGELAPAASSLVLLATGLPDPDSAAASRAADTAAVLPVLSNSADSGAPSGLVGACGCVHLAFVNTGHLQEEGQAGKHGSARRRTAAHLLKHGGQRGGALERALLVKSLEHGRRRRALDHLSLAS